MLENWKAPNHAFRMEEEGREDAKSISGAYNFFYIKKKLILGSTINNFLTFICEMPLKYISCCPLRKSYKIIHKYFF